VPKGSNSDTHTDTDIDRPENVVQLASSLNQMVAILFTFFSSSFSRNCIWSTVTSNGKLQHDVSVNAKNQKQFVNPKSIFKLRVGKTDLSCGPAVSPSPDTNWATIWRLASTGAASPDFFSDILNTKGNPTEGKGRKERRKEGKSPKRATWFFFFYLFLFWETNTTNKHKQENGYKGIVVFNMILGWQE